MELLYLHVSAMPLNLKHKWHQQQRRQTAKLLLLVHWEFIFISRKHSDWTLEKTIVVFMLCQKELVYSSLKKHLNVKHVAANANVGVNSTYF